MFLQAKRNTLKGSAALNIYKVAEKVTAEICFKWHVFEDYCCNCRLCFQVRRNCSQLPFQYFCRKISAVKIQTLRPMDFCFCNVFVAQVML